MHTLRRLPDHLARLSPARARPTPKLTRREGRSVSKVKRRSEKVRTEHHSELFQMHAVGVSCTFFFRFSTLTRRDGGAPDCVVEFVFVGCDDERDRAGEFDVRF